MIAYCYHVSQFADSLRAERGGKHQGSSPARAAERQRPRFEHTGASIEFRSDSRPSLLNSGHEQAQGPFQLHTANRATRRAVSTMHRRRSGTNSKSGRNPANSRERVCLDKAGAVLRSAGTLQTRTKSEGRSYAQAAHSPLRVSSVRGNQVRQAMRRMAARLSSTSASVVAQLETEMRIAVWPCQFVGPHQQVPSDWTSRMTR